MRTAGIRAAYHPAKCGKLFISCVTPTRTICFKQNHVHGIKFCKLLITNIDAFGSKWNGNERRLSKPRPGKIPHGTTDNDI